MPKTSKPRTDNFADELDFYKILGVDSKATAKTITKAYRTLSLKYHPDKNKNNPQAERNFQLLTAAYKVLSNPEERAFYDSVPRDYYVEYHKLSEENKKAQRDEVRKRQSKQAQSNAAQTSQNNINLWHGALKDAITRNDQDRLKILLTSLKDAQISILQFHFDELSLFAYAIRFSSVEIVALLHPFYKKVNTEKILRCLAYRLKNNALVFNAELLNLFPGLDVNSKISFLNDEIQDTTLLFLAVMNNNEAAVKVLLMRDANVSLVTEWGIEKLTPLQYAGKNQLDSIYLFLKCKKYFDEGIACLNKQNSIDDAKEYFKIAETTDPDFFADLLRNFVEQQSHAPKPIIGSEEQQYLLSIAQADKNFKSQDPYTKLIKLKTAEVKAFSEFVLKLEIAKTSKKNQENPLLGKRLWIIQKAQQLELSSLLLKVKNDIKKHGSTAVIVSRNLTFFSDYLNESARGKHNPQRLAYCTEFLNKLSLDFDKKDNYSRQKRLLKNLYILKGMLLLDVKEIQSKSYFSMLFNCAMTSRLSKQVEKEIKDLEKKSGVKSTRKIPQIKTELDALNRAYGSAFRRFIALFIKPTLDKANISEITAARDHALNRLKPSVA